jgi:hypothetical protein
MKKLIPNRILRTRGPSPQMLDSEVLTMEIVEILSSTITAELRVLQ